MEYWSVGVLRQVRIAPCVRGVEDAKGAADESFRYFVRRLVNEYRLYRPVVGADRFMDIYPGLKPRATRG